MFWVILGIIIYFILMCAFSGHEYMEKKKRDAGMDNNDKRKK